MFSITYLVTFLFAFFIQICIGSITVDDGNSNGVNPINFENQACLIPPCGDDNYV